MADGDRKEEKKEEKKGSSGDDSFEELGFWLIVGGIGLFVLSNLGAGIMALLSGGQLTGPLAVYLSPVLNFFSFLLPFLQISSIIVTAVFAMLLVYVGRRSNELLEEMKNQVYPQGYRPKSPSLIDAFLPGAQEGEMEALENREVLESIHPRWKKVATLMQSDNQSDWRQAIIEADILLGELLDTLGYRGAGIGEKLRAIEPSDMQSYEAAWEAHKFRNRIAHEGSNMLLSQREARRIIGLFEKIFKEYNYI